MIKMHNFGICIILTFHCKVFIFEKKNYDFDTSEGSVHTIGFEERK
jgi:hypothetical protein